MRRRTALCVEAIEPRYLLSGLAFSLTTNESAYQVGQPIQMTFTETNTSSQPVTIVIGPVNSGFDVMQNGVTVWASNAGIQPQYLQLRTLAPGQSATLTATWNGESNVGPPTQETGTFTVTNQQAPMGASATFTIEGATPPKVQTPLQNDPALSATLTTSKPTYRLGQPVSMTLTLTNTSEALVTITPSPAFDGFYVSHGTVVVWHQAATAVPQAGLAIAPGQTVTFTTTWNGRPNQHGAGGIRPGTYLLAADLGDYQVSTTIEIGTHNTPDQSRKG